MSSPKRKSVPAAKKATAAESGAFFAIDPSDDREEEETRITMLQRRISLERSAESGPQRALSIDPTTDPGGSGIPGIFELGCKTFDPRSPQGRGVAADQRGWYLAYQCSGRSEWFGANRIYELRAGSMCLVPPGVPHSGFDHVIQSCRVYWAVIDPVLLADKVSVAAKLKHHLGQANDLAFFAGLPLESLFERVVSAHQAEDDLASFRARTAMLLLLAEAISAEAASGDTLRSRCDTLPEVVIQATRAFSSDLGCIPTVAQVARQCGISRGHLHRLFTEHLGASPKAYVQELRLRRARDLLKQGMPIRDAAQRVSLATAGELRRLFMQAIGCQPEEWLARHAQLWKSGERLPGQAE